MLENNISNILPRDSGPYRVMQDIDNYNKLGGMKKQLADIGMQIYTMNQILARQNRLMMMVLKLEDYHGMSEEQYWICQTSLEHADLLGSTEEHVGPSLHALFIF
jgi:hypothetical protein